MDNSTSVKKLSVSKLIFCLLISLLIIAAVTVFCINKNENEELSSLSENVNDLIAAGKFKEALSEAESIQYNGKLSWRSAQKWSSERESLISSVLTAKQKDLEENGVSFPLASSVLIGTSAADAETLLRNAGFTNIEEKELPYEKTAYFDPGDITEITIGGVREVFAGDLFLPDTPVFCDETMWGAIVKASISRH